MKTKRISCWISEVWIGPDGARTRYAQLTRTFNVNPTEAQRFSLRFAKSRDVLLMITRQAFIEIPLPECGETQLPLPGMDGQE